MLIHCLLKTSGTVKETLPYVNGAKKINPDTRTANKRATNETKGNVFKEFGFSEGVAHSFVLLLVNKNSNNAAANKAASRCAGK